MLPKLEQIFWLSPSQAPVVFCFSFLGPAPNCNFQNVLNPSKTLGRQCFLDVLKWRDEIE